MGAITAARTETMDGFCLSSGQISWQMRAQMGNHFSAATVRIGRGTLKTRCRILELENRMSPSQYSFPADTRLQQPSSKAVVIIALILMLATMSIAGSFLIPVTLAFLLFFVFARLRRALARRGAPAALVAGVIVFGLGVVMVIILVSIAAPATTLLGKIPEISGRLQDKVEGLRGSFSILDAALASFRGTVDPESALVGSSAFIALVTSMPEVLGQVFFVLCLLFFLILCGDLLYLKIVQSFDTIGDKRAAYKALRNIEDSLGQYLGTITLINAGLGLAIGLAMWALGMPSPALFGLIGFLFNFVPYIGAIAGAAIATFVALMGFPGVGFPLLVGGAYLALTAVEGQFITPIYVSRRLQMNPVVVFTAIALGAYLWSIVGMVVAVPLLVVMGVIADHVPSLFKFGNFLSGEAPPVLSEDDPPAEPQPTPDDTSSKAVS